MGSGISIPLQNYLGLRNLRLLNHMNSFGATASAMIQYAAMAVHHGMANYVACVFADAPLQKGGSAGAAYGGAGRRGPSGMASLMPAFGFYGANTSYALAARRYMEQYGVTNDHFGRVSVAQREWATMNPHATMRDPITLEDYHNSRWIVEPFHLLDCCLVSNGAVATIVTTAERAKDLSPTPPTSGAWARATPGNLPHADVETGTTSGAVIRRRNRLQHGRRRARKTWTSASSMTATPTPSCARLRTTAWSVRAKPPIGSPKATPAPADRFPSTPAADSSPPTTCGA